MLMSWTLSHRCGLDVWAQYWAGPVLCSDELLLFIQYKECWWRNLLFSKEKAARRTIKCAWLIMMMMMRPRPGRQRWPSGNNKNSSSTCEMWDVRCEDTTRLHCYGAAPGYLEWHQPSLATVPTRQESSSSVSWSLLGETRVPTGPGLIVGEREEQENTLRLRFVTAVRRRQLRDILK